VWALVFVAYWLVWDLGFGPAGSPGAGVGRTVDVGRRQVITALPLAIGLGSLFLVGVLKVPGWIRAVAAPPESGLKGPVPELTPVNNFYKVSKNFQDPVVAEASWSLRVTGLVGRQLNLRLSELKALPAATQVMTLECISNEVGGNLMSTGKFA